MKIALPLIATALLTGTALHAAPPTATDRAFVAKVSQGGMFEVNAGKLAAQKASAPDVRDFAVAESHDHMLVGDGLKAVASAKGIAIATRPNAEFAGKFDRLSKLSGPAFDAAYMAEMASLHDADGAAFAAESTAGGSAAFRRFAAQTHKIVARHIGAIHGATPS